MPITRRQREVLDHLSANAAFSRDKARTVLYGIDANVAEKLAAGGVINKRYDADRGAVYWIRSEGESATGASIEAGFVVILQDRDVKTPSGRAENFFLARARYDTAKKRPSGDSCAVGCRRLAFTARICSGAASALK